MRTLGRSRSAPKRREAARRAREAPWDKRPPWDNSISHPRRISDYPEAFAGWNFVSSIGANISYAGTLFFVVTMLYTLFAGRRAPANPWGEGATTLEWTMSSPPPFHSHDEIPVVR